MIEQATLVRVTPWCIAHGKARDCEKCPVALGIVIALGDLLPEGSLVDVGAQTADVYLPDGETWQAALPLAARKFVYAFDESDDGFGPFEFTLTWRLMPEGAMA